MIFIRMCTCILISSTYGFENQDIQTWIVAENEIDTVIVYKYYNSFQLFQISEPSDGNIKEICFLSEQNQIQMCPDVLI